MRSISLCGEWILSRQLNNMAAKQSTGTSNYNLLKSNNKLIHIQACYNSH